VHILNRLPIFTEIGAQMDGVRHSVLTVENVAPIKLVPLCPVYF
jgi:hypothetical protein